MNVKVRSETNVNTEYTVTVDDAGNPRSCECLSRTYRPSQPCKHMRAVCTVGSLPASTVTPLQVPASTRSSTTVPAPQTPSVRFPTNLTEHLAFAFNPGALG